MSILFTQIKFNRRNFVPDLFTNGSTYLVKPPHIFVFCVSVCVPVLVTINSSHFGEVKLLTSRVDLSNHHMSFQFRRTILMRRGLYNWYFIPLIVKCQPSNILQFMQISSQYVLVCVCACKCVGFLVREEDGLIS